MEWNGVDVNIRNSASCNVFKRAILKFIRPEPNQVLNIDSSEGLKFLTRIRPGLSHLADHKFRHKFQDCVNPISSCGRRLKLHPISCFADLTTIMQDRPSLKK